VTNGNDQGGSPRGVLRVVDGAPGSGPFDIVKEETTFGRSSYVDCPIRSEHVSRIHFAVRIKGDRFVVVDKDSLNGVSVNGSAVRGEKTLSDGDEIAFGPVRCVFESAAVATGGENKIRNLAIVGGVTAALIGLLLYYLASLGAQGPGGADDPVRIALDEVVAGLQEVMERTGSIARADDPDERELEGAARDIDRALRAGRQAEGDVRDFLAANPDAEAAFAEPREALAALVKAASDRRNGIRRSLSDSQRTRAGAEADRLAARLERDLGTAVETARALIDSANPDFAGAASVIETALAGPTGAVGELSRALESTALDEDARSALRRRITDAAEGTAAGELRSLSAVAGVGRKYLSAKDSGDIEQARQFRDKLKDSAKTGFPRLLAWVAKEEDSDIDDLNEAYRRAVGLKEAGKKREAYELLFRYALEYKDSDAPSVRTVVKNMNRIMQDLDEEAKQLYESGKRKYEAWQHGTGNVRAAKDLLEQVLEIVDRDSRYGKAAAAVLDDIEKIVGTQ